ncbi:MAG: hypothetical protein J6J03_04330 [Tyzzerella sp.]|nr:hypothetical protein [Tyzzerella sp.]
MNAHIAAVDEVLMNADSLGIIASGTYATDNTTDIVVQTGSLGATTNRQLNATITYDDILYDNKVKCIESITGTTDYGVLTGVFNYRGKVALYVVNYDTVTEAGQKVTIAFTDDYRYRTIDASGEVEHVGQSCEYTLAPGQAVLIVLDSLVGDADRSVALTSQDLVRYKKMEQNVADVDFAYEYAADLNCDEQINKTDTIWTRWKLVGYMVKDILSL